LRAVAEGASRRAQLAGQPLRTAALAAAAGWLHDLGKYRPGFQCHVRGGQIAREESSHKQAGAALAFRERNNPLALVILGHHGGVPDGSSLSQLASATVCPAGLPVVDQIWFDAVGDCPPLLELDLTPADVGKGLWADLFTRVLFSCLVDADWADTGRHERTIVYGLPPEPAPPSLEPEERLKRVEAFIADRAARPLEPHVKQARATVLDACLAAAANPPGLYSLTVPTGGGKTLAALAFALKHAASHGLRRVIYVAPYMTILEQNADAIRAALGVGPTDPAVFEHYSLAEPPADDSEETRPGAAARRSENWDAPVVVTTNVQLFESLFSNKPGRCRKLHNVARSVVILDECQTLPPGLAAPTCGMLKQLATPTAAGGFGCSVVLCTATQPAFNHARLKDDERLEAREIVPARVDLFEKLKRVHVTWPKKDDVPLTWAAVADRMREEPAALCVVNTKKAARAVYDELKNLGLSGVFHLSTGMCPQHRREKLAQVRRLLEMKAPCYVASTQLIEAGVDVDFPFVMREMGPLESVIQAAGRCNREGKMPGAGGRVVVFWSADGKMPPDRWYNAGRDTIRAIIAANTDGPQIDDPAAILDYFGRLYHTGSLDADGVQELRKKFRFASVAETYKLIADAGQPVVAATWASHRAEIDALVVEVRTQPRKSTYRQLAKFQINLLPSQRLKVEHLLHEEPSGVLVWDGRYDDDAGIVEERADEFII
jgi:CRISPR-associated endonuclease/helicase Cas3